MEEYGKQIILPYLVRPFELNVPRMAEYQEPIPDSFSATRMTNDGKGSCIATTQLPLIMLKRKQNLSKSQDPYGYWKYGTTDWITRLLYTGQISSSFFDHICNRGLRYRDIKDRPFMYKVEPTVEPNITRKVQLWEPKKLDRQQTAKQAYFDVLNARLRKKDIMDQVARTKEKNRQHCEQILLKHSETMNKGLIAYLNKMDRACETYRAKNQSKSLINTPVPLKQEEDEAERLNQHKLLRETHLHQKCSV